MAAAIFVTVTVTVPSVAEDFEVARGGTRLTMVLVCADPCLAHALAHAHAHVRDAGRHDTTVGMASDEWYYILGSSSNVTGYFFLVYTTE